MTPKSKTKAKTTEDTTPAPKKPVTLGSKWACPKCATKFYDFGKEEGKCPKCSAMINFKDLQQAFLASLAPSGKKAKAKPVEVEEPDIPAVAATEALDDLDDAPETSLEDLEVDDDKDDDE